MDQLIYNSIIAFIKERFSSDSSGHDLSHTMRVYRTAMTISSIEGGDRDVIAIAALLHDVDDCKLFGGKQGSSDTSRSFMIKLGIDSDIIEKVCEIIADISFKGKDTKAPNSLEGRIVQDADRLDAIGAIGIARAFSYGGSRGRAMYDPDNKPKLNMNSKEYFANKGTTINHFHEKLLLLKDLMNTETGKRMAESRHDYMISFLEEFHSEWDGVK